MTLIGTQDRISIHARSVSSTAGMILAAFGFARRTGKLWHRVCRSEKTEASRKSPYHGGRRSRVLPFFLIIPMLFSSSGCAPRMGPKMIARDRFDYSSVIERSWKEQMLLNMVRLRYYDPPFFLDVKQVIAQYTFEGSGSVSTPSWAGDPSGPAVALSGRWAESPTITFDPMSGEKFTKSLLQPISPTDVWSLVEAGWPISDIFKVAIRSINGLHATTTAHALKHPGDPDFYRVVSLLQELQAADAFGLRVEEHDGKGTGIVTFFRAGTADESALEAARTLRQLLRLSPDAKEFKLTFGALPQDDKEIAMLTRSMLEILMEATAGVEIPDSDIREGRASKLDDEESSTEAKGTFKVRVRSSSERPPANESFASVRYRNQWFWIDDRDLAAKRGLSFLMVLFTLVESGAPTAPPVLTISKP